MALGYSVCSEEMYPSIRFTGKRAEDSLGIMTFQEIELYKGLNYANTFQAGYDQNRWGDYSAMMTDPADDSTFWYTNMYTKATTTLGNWATRIFSINLTEDTAVPYAFAGNDTVALNVLFFQTQAEAENYSSIIWTTGGDGNFVTNYAEDVTYLRGPGDLDSGQVTLTMHLTGYYPGAEAADSMILYLLPVGMEEPQAEQIALSIYPNPATDLITLRATVPPNDPVTVEVFGEDTKVIFTGRYTPADSQFELQFDVSYLPAGIYLVRLQAGSAATGKIVVQ
jgi:hypothetical protein